MAGTASGLQGHFEVQNAETGVGVGGGELPLNCMTILVRERGA